MDVFLESMKKYRVLWGFTLIMLLMAIYTLIQGDQRSMLVYNQNLDEVVATVQGEEITLRDFAVYVAYQEMEIDRQAKVYNPDNPKEYWGLHTNGQFIKVAARQGAVNMAIHDILFYQLGQELKLVLTEEELTVLNNDVMDFWSDLTDDGKEARLGITEQELYDSMHKIALAEKAQYIYARMNGYAYEDYVFSAEEYQEFLQGYEYVIDEKVLNRIDFGDVTLNY